MWYECTIASALLRPSPRECAVVGDELDPLPDPAQIDRRAGGQRPQPARTPPDRLQRVHRCLALEAADGLRQAEAGRWRDDLRFLAGPPPLDAGALRDQLLSWRSRRRLCCRYTCSSYSCGGDGASISSACLPRASASIVAREP